MTKDEMLQTVNTYNDYLNRMTNAAQHLCEDIQANNFEQLSPVIPSIVDGLEWVNEAVNHFVRLGSLGPENAESFHNIIKSLTESLENKDYILLHDLLEFELIPLLGNIKIANMEVN